VLSTDYLIINEFETFEINHLKRKYNLYANALSQIPFNVSIMGNVRWVYHSVNRAKNRFYQRLKYGIEYDISVNSIQKTTKASAYTKIKAIKEILEYLSSKNSLSIKEIKKVDKMFNKLYFLFHELLVKKNLDLNENPKALLEVIKLCKIRKEIYPQWFLNKLVDIDNNNKIDFKISK
jgi:hypothetical protein